MQSSMTMRVRYHAPFCFTGTATLALLIALLLVTSARAEQRPNVLIILADDLGYADLGCYGGEIETPNLDSLAAGGLRFTQFHNTARCWPTRAALLSGYYAQQVRRDAFPAVQGLKAGVAGARPEWSRLLPELLAQAGYHSYHSGKWHIDQTPLLTGFQHSYSLQDHGRYFSPRNHTLDDQPLPAVERGSGHYDTTNIADHAIKFLRRHAANHPDEPFFEYLAFTAPHFPLHALPEDIERYRERYRRGWDVVRRERWERQQELGLFSGELSEVELEVGPPYHFPTALEILGPHEVNRPIAWDELTPEQQDFQATKMAIHAAMVDRMDREIGRVLTQLREMGAWDNTLILFLSDNGATAEIMVRDDGHDPQAPAGSAATYLCLGPGWSTVCNTPFRRHKTWVHEGGTCTPLVVHWPRGIEDQDQLRRTPGHVIDIVPTILELVGLESPRPEAPPLPGQSLLPAFSADTSIARDDFWWLHEGNRALRVGDWKIVAAKGDPWELYDLSTDPAETTDLAAEHPQRVAEMAARWEARLEEYLHVATADQEVAP